MKVDYRTQYYFPRNVVTLGHAMIFLGAVVLTLIHWIAGVVMIGTGLLIVSVNYGIVIDSDKKWYNDYLFILGANLGKRTPYEAIEYLMISDTHKPEELPKKASRGHMAQHVFSGYIKFSDQEGVHLLSSRKKQKVMHFLQKLANELNLEIRDLSE